MVIMGGVVVKHHFQMRESPGSRKSKGERLQPFDVRPVNFHFRHTWHTSEVAKGLAIGKVLKLHFLG